MRLCAPPASFNKQLSHHNSNMKAFIVLCAVAMASAGVARDKRSGWSSGWDSGALSSGWDSGALSSGWDSGISSGWSGSSGLSSGWSGHGGWSAPSAHVVAVKKVVHVPRTVVVPKVVHVQKVISEPQVVTVKKYVSTGHSGGGYSSGLSGGYANGWW